MKDFREELTGDGMLTLKMTRTVYPYFKELLETNTLFVGEDKVTVEVEEGPSGEITLWIIKQTRQTDAKKD